MKKVLLLLLMISFAKANDFSPNRLVVKFKEVPTNLNHVTKVKNLFANNYVVYTNDLKKALKELEGHDAVISVDKDFKSEKRELATMEHGLNDSINTIELQTSFNDPLVSKQWALKSAFSHGVSMLKAYELMDFSPAKEIIVAVVDTGVESTHEDLKNVMWTNPGEIPGDGIDNDDNGYVDDVYGINTLVRDDQNNATGNIEDAHGHGTHVAGIIAAEQNNNKGIAGIANNVKIMGIRTVPNYGDETDVDVVESFIYAAKHGAKIINCSFGKAVNEGGNIVSEAISHISKEYGVLVVAAAGNETSNIDQKFKYPASFPNDSLLVVASTSNWGGGLSYFSNYGKENVDIAAPGSWIQSTFKGNRYSSLSGTSMASPVVAGIAALLWGMNEDLNHLELKELMLQTVDKKSRFTNKMQSGGRANLLTAITKILE